MESRAENTSGFEEPPLYGGELKEPGRSRVFEYIASRIAMTTLSANETVNTETNFGEEKRKE